MPYFYEVVGCSRRDLSRNDAEMKREISRGGDLQYEAPDGSERASILMDATAEVEQMKQGAIVLEPAAVQLRILYRILFECMLKDQ